MDVFGFDRTGRGMNGLHLQVGAVGVGRRLEETHRLAGAWVDDGLFCLSHGGDSLV